MAAAEDVSSLASTLQNMARKTQLMQHFRQNMPMNPMNLSLVDIDPAEAVEIPTDLPCLPLTTMEHLDAFENLLFNDVHFKQVVRFFGLFTICANIAFFAMF